jgi:hypothetical protein
MVSLFSLCLSAGAQSNQSPNPGESSPPSAQPRYRPKLPLQEALRIAESYIDEQRIDISSYWLNHATLIFMGDETTPPEKKLPCWHFLWMNDSGYLGDYVEILVTMDGKPSRAVSM